MCKLNSPEANYKESTSGEDEKKIIIIIALTQN
jgi:hypothetical protein